MERGGTVGTDDNAMTRMDEARSRMGALIGEHEGADPSHHAHVLRDVFGVTTYDLAVLYDFVDDLLRHTLPPEVWDHDDVEMDEVVGISLLTFQLGAQFERLRREPSEETPDDD